MLQKPKARSQKPKAVAPAPVYYVYAIRLEGLPDESVYVGYSSLPPAERFRRHKTGDKRATSRYARRYGTRLLPQLYSRMNPIATRAGAREAEQVLRRKLEARGIRVYGACVVGREPGCRI